MTWMPGVPGLLYQRGVNRLYSTSNLFILCWSISMVHLGRCKYRIPARSRALGGHWFADETPMSLRPPTWCFSIVILTTNWLNHLCISFSLPIHFSRCSKVTPLRFHFFGWLLGCEWQYRRSLDMVVPISFSCEPLTLKPKG